MATPEVEIKDDTEAKVVLEKFEQAESPEKPEMPPVTAEDDITKPVAEKDWHFKAEYKIVLGKDNAIEETFDRVYTQKPLSYHAMIEFTGLLARKLDEAMSGPEGLSIDKILPDEKLPFVFTEGQITVAKPDNFEGLDSILKGFLKLASYVPDFLSEAQCIWLRVPRNERLLLIDIWSRPVDEGGLSMKQGEEILSLFIEQNYEELEYFLTKWWKNQWTAIQRSRKRKVQEES